MYQGKAVHLKVTVNDTATALISSEESWPPLATGSCILGVIKAGIPTIIFMARAFAQGLTCNHETDSGNNTVLWSVASFEDCGVSSTQNNVGRLGMAS